VGIITAIRDAPVANQQAPVCEVIQSGIVFKRIARRVANRGPQQLIAGFGGHSLRPPAATLGRLRALPSKTVCCLSGVLVMTHAGSGESASGGRQRPGWKLPQVPDATEFNTASRACFTRAAASVSSGSAPRDPFSSCPSTARLRAAFLPETSLSGLEPISAVARRKRWSRS